MFASLLRVFECVLARRLRGFVRVFASADFMTE